MSSLTRRDCITYGALAAGAFAGLSFPGKSAAAQSGALFPGERVMEGAGFPALAQFRRGDPSRPLVVCLPGGGHLARVFYGHPQARPEDFLLTHLSQAGFSVLALSYPSAHPSLNRPVPGMTITQWADSSAAIAAEFIARERLSSAVIGVGWSLAGRVARDFSLALRNRSVALELFIGLSAAPPLPGFGELTAADLQFAPSGLLDGSSADSSIFRGREPHLQAMDRINGRVIVPRDIYARDYVTDSPINFRGEAERYTDRGIVTDLPAAVADQGTFDYKNYPLCAAIAATSPLDMLHSLTNSSIWGALCTQALYYQVIRPALAAGVARADHPLRELDPVKWAAVRSLMAAVPARFSRHVEGSHFFFIGEAGAKATATYIQDLAAEATKIRRELTALLS